MMYSLKFGLFPNLVDDGEEKEDTVKGAKYA